MAVHHSTCGTGAGAWLHAPTGGITPLSNHDFITASLIRFDKPHIDRPTTCPRHTPTNACRQPVNTHLDHALTCQYGPHRVRRHNRLRDALAALIFEITGFRPLTEQLLITTTAPTRTRTVPLQPADEDTTPLNRSDITFHTAGPTLHLDVMVTSATTSTALAGTTNATNTPAHAATLAELYKRNKYHPHPVTPVIFETHDRMGGTLLDFLHQLTSTLPTPHEQTTAYHYCIQQLSTTLQRCNAETIHAHHAYTTAAAAPAAAHPPPTPSIQ